MLLDYEVHAVDCIASIETIGRTGVEIKALTAVSIGPLEQRGRKLSVWLSDALSCPSPTSNAHGVLGFQYETKIRL